MNEQRASEAAAQFNEMEWCCLVDLWVMGGATRQCSAKRKQTTTTTPWMNVAENKERECSSSLRQFIDGMINEINEWSGEKKSKRSAKAAAAVSRKGKERQQSINSPIQKERIGWIDWNCFSFPAEGLSFLLLFVFGWKKSKPSINQRSWLNDWLALLSFSYSLNWLVMRPSRLCRAPFRSKK